ncbi:MAG: 2-hydroxyhepta-2,4-diene,7-dioate isomerase [Gemmatimonadetes bacterium]|nr:2-hydroxyhepta-2,4-diene,7-dioate isomerase [Gemmatimonadota bacterium]
MKLYRTNASVVLSYGSVLQAIEDEWDALINHEHLAAYLSTLVRDAPMQTLHAKSTREERLAPIGSQEVWAAGVTYYRSRSARIEESQDAGGGTFYDRVYTAERPELFFKAAPWRVRGPGAFIRTRRDARWSVPEPELALCVNSRGTIVGYTIGNDVSSRDIEGENPLYLPQAKTYDGSCALGPALYVSEDPLAPGTAIELRITRRGAVAFQGDTTISQMRRTPQELVEFLYRETSFPHGCILLTGTGVIPPDDFTLESGDVVDITIAPIGTLSNTVE